MAWQSNEGRLPDACLILDEQGEVTGYRKVHVRLHGGWDSKAAGHDPWPAGGGRPPTEWRISRKPGPFEIESYEVV